MPRHAIRSATFAIVVLTAVAACSSAAAPSSAPSVALANPSPSASAESASLSPSVAPATLAPTEAPAPSKSHKPLPSIDQSELDAYLTSSITLIDLADDDLAVDVAIIDPTSDESIALGTYTLAAEEQMTNQVPPGTYRLVFRQPAAKKTGSTCTIEVTDTDGYIFAAVPGSIAITRTGTKPKAAGDLFVATSSLCRG